MLKKVALLCFLPLALYCEDPIFQLPSSLVTQSSSTANEQIRDRSFFKQWFMGPLLVPSPTTANPKNPGFEPTITATNTYGNHDNHWKIHKATHNMTSVQYLAYWQQGLSKHIGFEFMASILSSYTKQASSTYFNDTIFRIGYQLTYDKKIQDDWTPNTRIILAEVFPTGHYNRLRADKQGTDLTGEGSFQTGLIFACEKGFKFHTDHAYNLYASIGYSIPTSFKVQKLNLYGGNNFTNGRIHPGNVLSVYFSGEYELSKHIAIAFDSNYQQNFSGRFTGTMGSGNPVVVPQTVTFSIAPEVEILITENGGLLIGPWFSFAGQNSPAFAGLFLAFLYIF